MRLGMLMLMLTKAVMGLTLGVQMTDIARYTGLQSIADYLGKVAGQNASIQTFMDDSVLANAVINRSLDLVLAGPGLTACLQCQAAVLPIATMTLNASNISTSYLAGSIIAHVNNTEINTAHDIVGKTVVAGGFTRLSSFQLQWAYLQARGVDLFTQVEGVMMTENGSDVLQKVFSREHPVGFVYAGEIQIFQAAGVYPSGSFKIIEPKNYPNYPYTCTSDLYPGQQLSAVNGLNQTLVTLITQSLPRAIAQLNQAGYAGVSAGFNVFDTLRLQASIGVQRAPFERCTGLQEIQREAKCSPGFTLTDISCEARGVTCPPNYICHCTPCMPTRDRIGGLGTKKFVLAIVLPILCTAALASWLVWMKRLRVPIIPANYLQLNMQNPVSAVERGTLHTALFKSVHVIASPVASKPRVDIGRLGVITEQTRQERLAHHRAQLQMQGTLVSLGVCRVRMRSYQLFATDAQTTLRHMLVNCSIPFDLQLCVGLLAGIATGLQHLHAHGLFGVDIRTHLVFVDPACHAYLLADTTQKPTMHRWQAPEVLKGGDPTMASDIYTFSMVAFEVLQRKEPFDELDEETVIREVKDTAVLDRNQIRPVLRRKYNCDSLYSVIEDCWHADPAHRPSLADIRGVITLIQDMINKSSRLPNSATGNFAFNKMAAFLYALGEPAAEFIGQHAAAYSATVIPSPETPNTCVAMAGDSDGCMRLCKLALLTTKEHPNVQIGMHFGQAPQYNIRSMGNATTCIVGSAIPIARVLKQNSRPGSVLCSEAVASHLTQTPLPDAVMQKRPASIRVRGFPDMSAYWLVTAGQ